MSQVSVQPSSGNQLASPNDSFSFLEPFNIISLYVGGVGVSIVLTSIILIFRTVAMKYNNPGIKKSEIEKNEKIALIIFFIGITLYLIAGVINTPLKNNL
jgi:hypothetical protein